MCEYQSNHKNVLPELNTEKKSDSLKTILLGEYGVGKTSIISRLMNPNNKELKTTTRIEYASKILSIGEKCIKLFIWDTMGQEKYRTLNKYFYKDSGVIILVYDITQKKSFDEIKNYWYQQIKNFAPKDIVLGIAANKCDLYMEQQVSSEEAKKFADDIGAIFQLTTNRNNSGIEELFKRIGCKILDPNYKEDKEDSKKQKYFLYRKNEQLKKEINDLKKYKTENEQLKKEINDLRICKMENDLLKKQIENIIDCKTENEQFKKRNK